MKRLLLLFVTRDLVLVYLLLSSLLYACPVQGHRGARHAPLQRLSAQTAGLIEPPVGAARDTSTMPESSMGSVDRNMSLGCVPTAGDTRVKVGTSTSSYPDYRAFATFLDLTLVDGTRTSCSASLVRGLMPSPWVAFLTAGHCLYLPARFSPIQSIVLNIDGVSSSVGAWTRGYCVGRWSKQWPSCADDNCDTRESALDSAARDYGILACNTQYVPSFGKFLNTGFGLLSNVQNNAMVFTVGFPFPQPDSGSRDGMWRAPHENGFVPISAVYDLVLDVSLLPLTAGQSGSPIVYYDGTNADYLVIGMMSGDSPGGTSGCINAASRLHPTTLVELTDLAVTIYDSADPLPGFGLGVDPAPPPLGYKYWLDVNQQVPNPACTLNPNLVYNDGGRPHAKADLTALWRLALAYISSSLTTNPKATQKFVYSITNLRQLQTYYPGWTPFLLADPTGCDSTQPPTANGCGSVTCQLLIPDAGPPTAAPAGFYFHYPVDVSKPDPNSPDIALTIRSAIVGPGGTYPYVVRMGSTTGPPYVINMQVPGQALTFRETLLQDNFIPTVWNF